MPPYWALGFQLCRYGYKDLNDIKSVVNNTKLHNIPHVSLIQDVLNQIEEQVIWIIVLYAQTLL
jgi:alpha-glucosidase (family GH31 glycosyl hydrolase)